MDLTTPSLIGALVFLGYAVLAGFGWTIGTWIGSKLIRSNP